MTEIADRPGQGQTGQSTTDQAKEKVQETAQQLQAKTHDVRQQAGERVRHEVDNRSTQAGSQLQSTADAMRRTGEQLRNEGNETPAKVTDAVAERAERLGSYMTEANADRILRDVEDFGRRQPWLLAAGGLALGFLASRFLKASSSSRFQSGNGGGQAGHPGGRTYGTYDSYARSGGGDVPAPGLPSAYVMTPEPEATPITGGAQGTGTSANEQ